MTISWLGAIVTFQVTFTELFIAATVIFSVAYKHGWRSAALGSLLGAAAIVLVSAALADLGQRLPTHVLDWISSVLLLGFGAYLLSEFWRAKPAAAPEPQAAGGASLAGRPVSLLGVAIAAWGMFVEGLEIMVVWLAIALKQGWATATAGVLIGLAVIGAVAALASGAGVFRRVPARYLDLIAGAMVILYGVYFLVQAAGANAPAP